MRLLLDTHVLIWALVGHERLGVRQRAEIGDPDNVILFSAASIWEIAIKSRLGRIDFGMPPEAIAEAAHDSGFEELPVRSAAAALVARLPQHHRDPFDHLLLAQAMTEPARFYTADAKLTRYSELVTLIG